MTPEVLAFLNGAGFLAIVGLLMRTESRITKLETLVQLLERDHLRPGAMPDACARSSQGGGVCGA